MLSTSPASTILYRDKFKKETKVKGRASTPCAGMPHLRPTEEAGKKPAQRSPCSAQSGQLQRDKSYSTCLTRNDFTKPSCPRQSSEDNACLFTDGGTPRSARFVQQALRFDFFFINLDLNSTAGRFLGGGFFCCLSKFDPIMPGWKRVVGSSQDQRWLTLL